MSRIQPKPYDDPRMEEALWQVIEKEHMEIMTKQTITDKEWNRFVSNYEGSFAEEVSILALDFWNEREIEELP